MQDKDLINILKTLKNDPALGGNFDVQKSWGLVAEKAGLDKEVEPRSYGFREYLEYGIYQAGNTMYKPVMAGAAAVLLIVGGWMGAFSTSLNALPGDSFYSLKLGIEKTQLALALTGDQHAKLQVEFANRRLGEMVELTALEPRTEDLHLAVNNLKEQVEGIQLDLTSVGASKLARAVERKADVKAIVVSKNLPADLQEKVNQVNLILEDNQEQAVNVMITAHEETGEEAALELKTAFEKELAKVEAGNLTTENLENVELAKALQKEGLYRRAFQVLKEIEITFNKE